MLQEKRPATDNLLLDSLEIKNFRPFEHLQIEHLGRVNLIVGKNSVGKSSLLEALWLYASRGAPTVIRTILETRDEFVPARTDDLRSEETERWLESLRNLFFGRENLLWGQLPTQIEIGVIDDKERKLGLGLKLFNRLGSYAGPEQLTLSDSDKYSEPLGLEIPGLSITLGSQASKTYFFDPDLRSYTRIDFKQISNIFVQAGSLDKLLLKNLWGNIALTDSEADVIRAMRIISPTVERVAIVDTNTRAGSSVIVKIQGQTNPLPLRSLGDGMNRVFGIALALVNCENGILLVDEIENGLHYTVQLDLWRIIFELAHRLNVQVFATTHSYECIRAFQQAAIEAKQSEGLLIRIENKKGKIVPTLFDERRLTIATQEDIEVR